MVKISEFRAEIQKNFGEDALHQTLKANPNNPKVKIYQSYEQLYLDKNEEQAIPSGVIEGMRRLVSKHLKTMSNQAAPIAPERVAILPPESDLKLDDSKESIIQQPDSTERSELLSVAEPVQQEQELIAPPKGSRCPPRLVAYAAVGALAALSASYYLSNQNQ